MTSPMQVRLSAVCDRCATIFPSGVMYGEGSRGNRFTGNKSGPCPNCGAQGSIPDAIYSLVDGVLDAVPFDKMSAAQLHRIADELKPIALATLPAEEIRARIERVVPEYAPTLLRGKWTRDQLLAVAGIIISLASLWVSMHPPTPSAVDHTSPPRVQIAGSIPPPTRAPVSSPVRLAASPPVTTSASSRPDRRRELKKNKGPKKKRRKL